MSSRAMGIRIAIVVLLLATRAGAQPPSQPPSQMLERAVRLYDNKDYFSASIELAKVLDQKVDTAQNLQRAEFFLAKTFYQMGFPAAAIAKIQQIQQQGPDHMYFNATAKWVAAIIRVAPSPSSRAPLGVYEDTLLDDPMMASVKDELAYHIGRELATRDVPRERVFAILARVSPNSEYAAKAQLELARLKFRAKDIDGGVRHAMTAASRQPALTYEAARLIASWTHTLGAYDRGRAPLAELARSSSYARYQHARAMLDGREEVRGIEKVGAEAFDAIMLTAACRTNGNWPDDLKPLARLTIDRVREDLDKLVNLDDNGELYGHVAKLRKIDPVIATAVGDPIMLERFAWIDELRRELDLLQRSDKAWQTTQIAADILQELTIVLAVEEADTGKQARIRLQLLASEAKQLAQALETASPAFALSAGPDVKAGAGLVVTRDLCTIDMPALAVGMPQRHSRTSGCAGCTTGGYEGAGASLLVFLALALRRKSRRSSSP